MQGVRVLSQGRELRSYMPSGPKKQNMKQKYCNRFNKDFEILRKNLKKKKKVNDSKSVLSLMTEYSKFCLDINLDLMRLWKPLL